MDNNEQIVNVQSEVINSNKITPRTIISSIIMLLLIILLVVLTLYVKNPKVILFKNISNIYNSLLENNNENTILKSILYNSNISISSKVIVNLNDEEKNNVVLNTKYIEDKEKKTGYLNIDSSISNEDLISLNSIMKDNKIYFKLKKLTEKYYYTDYKFVSILSNTTNDDIKYMLDIVKESITKNVKESEFIEEKTTIKINNKEEKVRKISFEITNKLISNIINDSLSEIKQDDKAMKILSENLEISINDLNQSIDGIIRDLNGNNSDSTSKIDYNIYVKGLNKVIKQELVIDTNSIEYYEYDNTKEMKLLSYNQSFAEIKIIGNETGKITGILDGLVLTGEYSQNKISLNLKPEGYTINDNKISFVIEISETLNNNEYKNNIDLSCQIINEGINMLDVDVIIENTIKNEEMPKIDISNSKDINQITEEEQTRITNKIMNIPLIQELMGTYTHNNQYDESVYE